MPERMERSLLGLLVIAVLLWVIAPALLYLAGWGASRPTRHAPPLINFRADQKDPSERPIEAPATTEV